MRTLVECGDVSRADQVPPPVNHEPGEGSRRRASSLTPRQLEVVRLRALGWTVDRIRTHLGIAMHTYYHHLAAAKERLGVSSEPEVWAALGWLQVPE